MGDIKKDIALLFQTYKKLPSDRIEQLPQSGSDRQYFRIWCRHETYIATANSNIKENNTFLYCTTHFMQKKLPVPEILAVNEDGTIYIQQDFGNATLLDVLNEQGYTPEVFKLYEQALSFLSEIQIAGHTGFDYSKCLVSGRFDSRAIMNDLLYFKYYFLDTQKISYDKHALQNDFEALSAYLGNSGPQYFMYRDFQSRNIMVNNGGVHFIDYQGGMNGPLQYDVASLLWQAKANLPESWKQQLLELYIAGAEEKLQSSIDRPSFISHYNGFVLIRLLQVLGAYGFRGLFENKAHFIDSIPNALRNLAFFNAHYKIDVEIKELDHILKAISDEKIISRFTTVKADETTPLVVNVYSFSYKKNLPADETGNGGGFLFDMRGILNPGRFAAYKKLTGRDQAVIDFLEQKTRMTAFLNSVFNIVDIAVEDYMVRGFENLLIGFGCTGGQHRSVYAADALAKHLINKFGVKVKVHHLVQDAKNWIN